MTLVSLIFCEDMALESCEGGELFDQITRVSFKLITCAFHVFVELPLRLLFNEKNSFYVVIFHPQLYIKEYGEYCNSFLKLMLT